MEQAEIIRADVDAKVTVMVAEAERNSRTVRGEGDALAAKVYADAYNKNAEFFSFVRSLEAYNRSFNSKSDILVVQPDSDFFQYMKSQTKR
jgi:membrane protease subunit HflC